MPDNEEEKDPLSKMGIDQLIQKKFLEERKIFLWGAVEDESARAIVERALYLEAKEPGKEISLYINSPGGSVTAGMAAYDTLKLISSPIRVVVTGLAASMGSILLCAGDKGKRSIMPHGRVLIHQPLIMGKMEGVAVDIHIHAQEMEKTRHELNRILSESSGQPIDRIEKDSDRDFYLNAEEAVKYGLVDEIITKL